MRFDLSHRVPIEGRADDDNLATQVTQLLLDWGKGEEAALQKLVPLVHKELQVTENRTFSMQCDHGERR